MNLNDQIELSIQQLEKSLGEFTEDQWIPVEDKDFWKVFGEKFGNLKN